MDLNCMLLGQFGINSPSYFSKHDEIARSEGNFFMFLKTNEEYFSQIARKEHVITS